MILLTYLKKKRSYAFKDEEKGKRPQRDDSERNKRCCRKVRARVRVLFREHEESEIQGVQGPVEIE